MYTTTPPLGAWLRAEQNSKYLSTQHTHFPLADRTDAHAAAEQGQAVAWAAWTTSGLHLRMDGALIPSTEHRAPAGQLSADPGREILFEPRGIVVRRPGHLEVQERTAPLAGALPRTLAVDMEGDAVLTEVRLPPCEPLRSGEGARLAHLVGGGRREAVL